MQSDSDYVVCKCSAGSGWLYSSWGPAIDQHAYNRQLKVRYQIGDKIPQKRQYIGTYPDREQAEKACQQDSDQKNRIKDHINREIQAGAV